MVHDRYLLLIAVSVLLLNLINTTGDFILAKMVDARAQLVPADARRQFIGAFYGDFQTYVSVFTAVVQIVLVARVFKRLGVGNALFVLPLLAVTGYGAAAVMPALAIVAAVKVFENSTDYSLQNTLQQALFLPTSRDAKYKAKSAIDTVSVRMGDLASTGLVFVGSQLHLGVLGYSVANIAAGLVWIWVAVHLRRRQLALVTTTTKAPPPARNAPHGTPTLARRRRIMIAPPPASRARRPRAAGRASGAGRRAGAPLVPGQAGRVERTRRRRRAAGARSQPPAGARSISAHPRLDRQRDRSRHGARARSPGRRRQRPGRGPVLDLVLPAQSRAGPERGRGRRRARSQRRRSCRCAIVKGKDQGATLGFQAVDAAGRKFIRQGSTRAARSG